MKALKGMIGRQVVVESFYHKEISGILTSAEESGIGVDKEIYIPTRAVFRIYLRDRFERDKKKEGEKDEKEPKRYGL